MRSGSREEIERWLADAIAARARIPAADVDRDAPFESFGLDSAAVVDVAGELGERLGRELPETLLFDRPTIAGVAAHLADGDPSGGEARRSPRRRHGAGRLEPIAIVGMGCRFPGADSPEEFWELLEQGRETVSEAPPERLGELAGSPPHPAVAYGGFVDGVDEFDPLFFGISPREAEHVDPQQRLLLEVAWEALEDAGQTAGLAGSATGVYVGICTSDYAQIQFREPRTVDRYATTGTASSIAANRLSYVFDLNGPSIAVDTACSSSLVALHLACQDLWTGATDMAVVGGANAMLRPEITLGLARLGLLADDGRCRAFDAAADGFVRGEGAGAVVLKPVSAAREDGDRVIAVVRGSGVNSDGRTNGITAPSRRAQESLLRQVYERAGVSPGDVQYVEAQGTGNRLADAIEAEALGAAIGAGRKLDSVCAVGSVKTNVGHLEAAAGVASLIKVALAMQHRTIPASLNFEEPNPAIRFDVLPLAVQSRTGPWPDGGRSMLAGVSAFGFGGTNAHAVLEGAGAD
ncbi:MAG TPA: type I polyketide synthase [Thermoleophilaceae bacterium]|jgi:acyl transferase domain-containing protein/acyl carrier protein